MHKELKQLDFALFLSILPHLLHMKIPIFIFLALILILLKSNKRFGSLWIMAISAIAIIVVWLTYGDELSRRYIQISSFLTFLAMLFIVLAFTSRLARKLTPFLTVMPFFILIFSLHYYDETFTMVYLLLYVYIFLVLYLWSRQEQSITDALKYANKMTVTAFPLIVLLFIFYPRYELPNRNDSKAYSKNLHSGFDGSLSLFNANSIVPSSETAFEVWFTKDTPPLDIFYFRGSVLYGQSSAHWRSSLSQENQGSLQNISDTQSYEYNINLEPHGQRWLYVLDYLSQTPLEALQYKDGSIVSEKKIEDLYGYSAQSSLQVPKNSITLQMRQKTLALSSHVAPILFEKTKYIRQMKDHSMRLDALMEFMRVQKLSYTLEPKKLTKSSPIDDFLFKTKEGYCVHFSTAFATAAQLVGIPSRVVTGYIAYADQMVKNYILVKQRNAHAWTEVYIDGKGWLRIESTNLATGDVNLDGLRSEGLRYYLDQLTLHVRFLLYSFQEFILSVEEFFNVNFLSDFFEELSALSKAGFGVFILTIISYLLIGHYSVKEKEHEIFSKKLLQLLKKYGYIKKKGESLESFIMDVASEYDLETKKVLLDINGHYHDWIYGQKDSYKKDCSQAYKRLKKILKKPNIENI